MKIGQQILLMGMSILTVGALAGCSSSQASPNAHVSATQSTKQHKKKAKIPTTRTKTTSSSQTSSSSATSQSKTKPVPSTSRKMNFQAIRHGDFSSLMGHWQPVAEQFNRQDGTGPKWEKPIETGPITITANKIENSDMSLTGSTLTSQGSSASVHFTYYDGALVANASIAAVNWAVNFYPSGVPYTQDKTTPSIVKTSADRIFIWDSSSQLVQVYQRE